MKVVRIGIDRPQVLTSGYRDWHRSRGLNVVLRPGEVIEGHVDFDRPNVRRAVYVRWVDSYGRLCERVRAEWNRKTGQPTFKLTLAVGASSARAIAPAGSASGTADRASNTRY